MSKTKRSTQIIEQSRKVSRVSNAKSVGDAKNIVKKTKENQIELIRELENQVYESKKNYNNIVTLLSYLSINNENTQEVIAASQSLRRIFISLIKSKECNVRLSSVVNSDVSQALSKVETWLNTQFWKFMQLSLRTVAFGENQSVSDAVIVAYIDTILDIACVDAKSDFSHLFNPTKNSILPQFLLAFFYSSPSPIALAHFQNQWLLKYDDFRYAVYKTLTKITGSLNITKQYKDLAITSDIGSELDVNVFAENVFNVLLEMKWGILSNQNIISKAGNNDISRQKRTMSELWTSILKNKFTAEGYKKVLMYMEHHIIPNVANPLALCDFLTDSFNVGGVASVLSLSGLFILMTKYNLDYPNFFNKLYSICDATTLTAKYRGRFFKLISLVLGGSYIPAYLVAAFAKRLLRLSLHTSPASSAYVLALVFNLVRKHPIIANIVNRNASIERGVIKNSQMPLDVINATYRPNTVKQPDEIKTDDLPDAIEDEDENENEEEQSDEPKTTFSLFSVIKTQNNDSKQSFTSSFLNPNSSNDNSPDVPLFLNNESKLKECQDPWNNGQDPFIQYDNDPSQTCALETSLLELSSLSEHYCPDVARVAKLFFADNGPKLGHNIDFFVNLSYEQLFNSSLDYRKNRLIPTNYERPYTLLGKSQKIVDPNLLFDDELKEKTKNISDKSSILSSTFEF